MMTYPDWTTGLHHDGSDVYVSNPYPQIDDTVMITLRAPLNAPLLAVFLRTEPDGEAHHEAMQIADTDSVSAYWQCELKITMPRNHYRFKLLTDTGAYWFNQHGITRADGPDFWDFKLLANYDAPLWTHNSVFYQIFPDRFYNGDPALTVKPGAWDVRDYSVQVRSWEDPPLPYHESGNLDFYGGDLPGIGQKLDYLQDLGVNAIYLTPIFTSPSNHRYNIDDFYNVDPYLGGNEALAELRRALDIYGMRVMLDITPNHVSSRNPWFLDAQVNPEAPTADFFTFNQRPDDYLAWLGVKTLPKLNYRSERLREVMYEGEDSVFRYWLKEPFRIDAWRLDVANMTGRQGISQLSHKVVRGIRRAVKAEMPEAYLIGENFFDGTPTLQGDELDATMNYQGFNIPMWRWLAGRDNHAPLDEPVLMPSEALAEQMAAYRAAIPWVIASQQFNQLGSHDTPRILTIVGGSRALAKLGAFMLMTYPGIPCIYYGDEIGMEGAGDPDNRRTMIWDESRWDHDLRQYYQKLIQLRQHSPALKIGGYQQVYAEGDIFAFQRHCLAQRLIVVAHRGNQEVLNFSLPVRHVGLADGATLVDRLTDATYTVENGAILFSSLEAVAMHLLEVQ